MERYDPLRGVFWPAGLPPRERACSVAAPAPGFYWLENYDSGLVAGPSKAAGGAAPPLALQSRSGDEAQLWSLAFATVDLHRVVLSSKADASQLVTLSGGGMEDGAHILQAAADGHFTQAWLILGRGRGRGLPASRSSASGRWRGLGQ